MAEVTIKQGDRLPKLARQFLTDGVATNLTGSTVVFNLWNAETGTQVITSGACTITSAVNGEVEYPWGVADATLPAGFYVGSFTASFGSLLLTAPNNGVISIQIVGAVESQWSYTGNPATRPIDRIRFLSGDTDSTNPQLNDQEMQYLIDTWTPNYYLAAAFACEAIGGKYLSILDTTKSVGDLSLSTKYADSAKGWMDRAHHLRDSSTKATPPIPNWDANGYPVSSEFKIGMDRNMGSGYTMPPVQFFPE